MDKKLLTFQRVYVLIPVHVYTRIVFKAQGVKENLQTFFSGRTGERLLDLLELLALFSSIYCTVPIYLVGRYLKGTYCLKGKVNRMYYYSRHKLCSSDHFSLY